MSIYTFKMAGDGLMELRRHGTLVLSIFPSEVAELASIAQAALAKQNSGVMGGCVCSKKASPVCSGFFGGKGLRCLTVIRQGCAVGEHSFVCDHDEACHQPQAQRREA